MDIVLEYTEDGIIVTNRDGDRNVLCTINRDDDSATTTTKLLNALMIEYKERFAGND